MYGKLRVRPNTINVTMPFQAIHQTRNGHLRRIFHQQVNMIISAVHADQGGLEVGTDLGKDRTKSLDGIAVERLQAFKFETQPSGQQKLGARPASKLAGTRT